MRSKFLLGSAAIAFGLGVGGASAVAMDLNMETNLQANSPAGSVLPPDGMQMNQSGLSAIKSTGNQAAAAAAQSGLTTQAFEGSEQALGRQHSGAGLMPQNMMSPPSK